MAAEGTCCDDCGARIPYCECIDEEEKEVTLVSDLKDRGINPAESPHDCLLEVDTDEHQAIIVWTESLQFHTEAGDNKSLFDADGWLTTEAESAVAQRLRRLIREATGHAVAIYTSYNGSDEPDVVFEVVTNYAEGETYEAWLDRIGWPVVGTLINVTDPGTFMSPYLFSDLEV